MALRIERWLPRAYVQVMRSFALRLLVLAALMTLPLGMATAPAQAHAMPPSALSSAGHCPDAAPAVDPAVGHSACAMPCSAALPAADLQPGLAELVTARAPQPVMQAALTSIVTEIATPPPKGA